MDDFSLEDGGTLRRTIAVQRLARSFATSKYFKSKVVLIIKIALIFYIDVNLVSKNKLCKSLHDSDVSAML